VLAGTCSGFVALALHQAMTVPLILRAELFEARAAATNPRPDAHHATHHLATPKSKALPGARFLANAVSEVLTGIAFALVLVSIWQWRQEVPSWPPGARWGVAGFLTLLLAPSLGLPPELPGTASAALPVRQAWWLATVAFTAAGLGLLAWRRSWLSRGLGLILLALPHASGAPVPHEATAMAPPALQQAFHLAVYASGLLFWITLGVLASLVYGRTARS
jgi:cobalt transporter subunit CbtA